MDKWAICCGVYEAQTVVLRKLIDAEFTTPIAYRMLKRVLFRLDEYMYSLSPSVSPTPHCGVRADINRLADVYGVC